MTSFRTILFAADLSEDSEGALALACSIAGQARTRLIVLQHRGDRSGSRERLKSHRLAEKALDRALCPRGCIDVEYQIREGKPSSEILRMAQEAGADVIVKGTHGRTGLRRLLVGSVAESVLHEARCPVMALHSHGGRACPTKFGSSSIRWRSRIIANTPSAQPARSRRISGLDSSFFTSARAGS